MVSPSPSENRELLTKMIGNNLICLAIHVI
jgi:hypothetical protein